jgi:hypothetical protein
MSRLGAGQDGAGEGTSFRGGGIAVAEVLWSGVTRTKIVLVVDTLSHRLPGYTPPRYTSSLPYTMRWRWNLKDLAKSAVE